MKLTLNINGKAIAIIAVFVGILMLSSQASSSILLLNDFDYSGADLTDYTYDYIIYKVGSSYYAKNGTDGTIDFSGTNASTVIQAAINAGDSLFFKSGEYEIPSTIYLDSNSKIEGNGNTNLYASNSNPVIFETLQLSDSSINALSDIQSGNLSIDVVSTTLEKDDYIRIMTTDDFFETAYDKGELLKIFRIDSATRITLTESCLFNYSSATITKLNINENINIKNINFYGLGQYVSDSNAIALNYCADSYISNCNIINCGYAGILIDGCYNIVISSCNIRNCHSYSPAYGYGITVSNAGRKTIIENCLFDYCRHGFSNGGSGYGIPAYIEISNCYFSNSESERQHSNGIYINMHDCIFENIPSVVLETPYTSFNNNKILNAPFEASNYSYNLIKSYDYVLRIGSTTSNCVGSSICNNFISFHSNQSTKEAIEVWFANNSIISENTIIDIDKALISYGIQLHPFGISDFDGLIISNNDIDVAGVGIYLGATGSYPINNVSINNNKIRFTTNGIYCTGSASTSVDNISIEGNRLIVGDSLTSGYAIRCRYTNNLNIFNNYIDTILSGSHLIYVLDDNNTHVFRNIGFITEAGGVWTLDAGTYRTITHNCSYTPTLDEIDIKLGGDIGINGTQWVSDITATTFRVNANSEANEIAFGWSIRRI